MCGITNNSTNKFASSRNAAFYVSIIDIRFMHLNLKSLQTYDRRVLIYARHYVEYNCTTYLRAIKYLEQRHFPSDRYAPLEKISCAL